MYIFVCRRLPPHYLPLLLDELLFVPVARFVTPVEGRDTLLPFTLERDVLLFGVNVLLGLRCVSVPVELRLPLNAELRLLLDLFTVVRVLLSRRLLMLLRLPSNDEFEVFLSVFVRCGLLF